MTSLTQLLMAIDYAVRYRHANGLDIRVITLAVGADNPDGYEHDPLAVAVERAWNAGVAVVTSGGNEGNSGQGLLLPAADPFVLAIGGADTQGTGNPSDDDVADWSSRGDGRRNPDVLAPGSSIVSYRVPGSFIDQSSTGRVGDDRQRGSGTSQAAAVAAGAAALLLERHDDWSPDQLKAAMREGARTMAGDPRAVGEGELDVAAADSAAVRLLRRRPPLLRRRAPPPRPPRPPLDRPPLDGREVERREVERRQVVRLRPGGG